MKLLARWGLDGDMGHERRSRFDGKGHRAVVAGLALAALLSAPLWALAGDAASAAGFSANGVVAFITDWGTRDFYVGAVKGVALTVYPDVRLIDITHGIEPYNIHEGAVTLWLAAREFPAGTVFVAVVDPGVGTERRPLAVQTADGKVFVGPDNGIFTLVMQEFGVASVRHIINRGYMRQGPISYSFHGRDVFTPAAAHIAAGWPVEAVGPEVWDYVTLEIEPASKQDGALVGEVVLIDQYGNLQANIPGALVEELGLQFGDRIIVEVGDRRVESVWVRTYGDVPEGADLAFLASTDLVEIAVNMGDARERFGAEMGDPVIIRKP